MRTFTQQFGLPPHAYLLQARIKKARTLLRTGMPRAEVAAAVGFADQSHFARHFKKIMGVTPSQYTVAKNPIGRETTAAPSADRMGDVLAPSTSKGVWSCSPTPSKFLSVIGTHRTAIRRLRSYIID